LHKDAPVAKQSRNLLVELDREARSLGRGSIWIPEPGVDDHYPVIGDIPYADIRQGLRKGARSGTKMKAWERVSGAASTYAPPPQSTANVPTRGMGMRPTTSKQTLRAQLEAIGAIDEKGKWLINPRGNSPEASMVRSLMVAFPVAEGRYPEFLGRKVPGTLFRRERGSVLRWDEISPEDVQIGGGFSPMKFARVTRYARFAPLKEAAMTQAIQALPTAAPGLRRQVAEGIAKGARIAGLKKLRTPRAGSQARLNAKWVRKGYSPKEMVARTKRIMAAPNVTTGEMNARIAALVPEYGAFLKSMGYVRRGQQPIVVHVHSEKEQPLVQAGTAVASGAAGAGATLLLDRLLGLLKRKKPRRYTLRTDERACLYAGFAEKLREEGIPAISRGALMGLIGAVQQELGLLPAITVDNIPVHRRSVEGKFARLGDSELRALAARIAVAPRNEGTKKALRDVQAELALRGEENT